MRKTRGNYRKLKAWDEAMNLWVQIYDITKNYPQDERFNLISQMRRASISIPSNIAEGNERKRDKEFYHFLGIALGSCVELETQVEGSRRVGLIYDIQASKISEQLLLVKKLIQGIKNSLS